MIKIKLSSAILGSNTTEADFDAWYAYVCKHIDDATGLVCEVEQAGFTGRTAIPTDEIDAPTNEQAEIVKRWLGNEGWDAFCSDPETTMQTPEQLAADRYPMPQRGPDPHRSERNGYIAGVKAARAEAAAALTEILARHGSAGSDREDLAEIDAFVTALTAE